MTDVKEKNKLLRSRKLDFFEYSTRSFHLVTTQSNQYFKHPLLRLRNEQRQCEHPSDVFKRWGRLFSQISSQLNGATQNVASRKTL